MRPLRKALDGGETLLTSGLVLQELLQGFSGSRARKQIIERFEALPLLPPDCQDHIDAAELRNVCRLAGVQVGTIDAVLAQLCIRHQLTPLTSTTTSSWLPPIARCTCGDGRHNRLR